MKRVLIHMISDRCLDGATLRSDQDRAGARRAPPAARSGPCRSRGFFSRRIWTRSARKAASICARMFG